MITSVMLNIDSMLTDLSLHTNIQVLYSQFSEFSGEHVLGVGQDLSPHYRLNLEQFRRWHPDSTLGDPGPGQVNTAENVCF